MLWLSKQDADDDAPATSSGELEGHCQAGARWTLALCDYMGESLEEKEWSREAARWFSLPLI